MKSATITLVVTKGSVAFTFADNTCEKEVPGHPVAAKELKKMYPNALLREYSDPRLSKRLRSMVDQIAAKG